MSLAISIFPASCFSGNKAYEAHGPLPLELQREFESIERELRQAVERMEYGSKRMKEAHYAASIGKGEYRKSSKRSDPSEWDPSLRGALVLLPATPELLGVIELVEILQPALIAVGIRLDSLRELFSYVRKLVGRRVPIGLIPIDVGDELASVTVRESKEQVVQILIGPWVFPDRRFSHWRPRERLAVVAAGDFEQRVALPMAAFVAYETLLHGLRAGYPAYDPDALMHEETRGCLFDLCVDKADIPEKLLHGIICPECRPKLEQLGIPVDKLAACLAGVGNLATGGSSA